jgi:hypothetical protein
MSNNNLSSDSQLVKLCDDICYALFPYLDLSEIQGFRLLCKRFNDLINIDQRISASCQRILKDKRSIIGLILTVTESIQSNMMHFPNLKKLDLYCMNIDSFDTIKLNLEELSITYCEGRFALNHMTKLRKLKIISYSLNYLDPMRKDAQFNHHDISELNLTDLSIHGSQRIRDLSHMTKLKTLDISETRLGDRGIRGLNHLHTLIAANCKNIHQQGINALNLRELNINKNQSISDVSWMRNLRILSVNYCNLISDQSLRGVDNLEELHCDGVENITDLNSMRNLKVLSICGSLSGVTDQGIQGLNLLELNLNDNTKITKISHMSNLKKLSIDIYLFDEDLEDYPGIQDDELKALNLEELHADGNPRVHDLNHMSNLRILHAEGVCGIGQLGIQGINLIKLYARDNEKITNLNHMHRLRYLGAKGRSAIGPRGISGLHLEKLSYRGNKNFKPENG